MYPLATQLLRLSTLHFPLAIRDPPLARSLARLQAQRRPPVSVRVPPRPLPFPILHFPSHSHSSYCSYQSHLSHRISSPAPAPSALSRKVGPPYGQSVLFPPA